MKNNKTESKQTYREMILSAVAKMGESFRSARDADQSYFKLGPMLLALDTEGVKPMQGGHSKGVRSRRRRAAKLRAAGFMHVDGHGWVAPEMTEESVNLYSDRTWG